MEKLIQELRSLFGVNLSPHQASSLMQYEHLLIEWNNKFNLTAIRESEGIRTKHFLDSLSCMSAWKENPPSRLIDIGTGAGFPGIPLKIVLPKLHLTLVESVGKKADFCKFVAKALDLDRVEVVQARAEELGQSTHYREKYDWAVARSVAALPALVEYLLPLVRVGGAALAQKGENGISEAQQAENACKILGGHLRQLRPVSLPGVVEERFLIIIDKIAPTPPQFPRRVGIPVKSPL
jgi:16S rRNA (guanine527-N7)-methyltransferase